MNNPSKEISSESSEPTPEQQFIRDLNLDKGYLFKLFKDESLDTSCRDYAKRLHLFHSVISFCIDSPEYVLFEGELGCENEDGEEIRLSYTNPVTLFGLPIETYHLLIDDIKTNDPDTTRTQLLSILSCYLNLDESSQKNILENATQTSNKDETQFIHDINDYWMMIYNVKKKIKDTYQDSSVILLPRYSEELLQNWQKGQLTELLKYLDLSTMEDLLYKSATIDFSLYEVGLGYGYEL